MSTNIREVPLWQNSGVSGPNEHVQWSWALLDKSGELTGRGVLFLFGACTAMVCYVLSCSLG